MLLVALLPVPVLLDEDPVPVLPEEDGVAVIVEPDVMLAVALDPVPVPMLLVD